MKIKVYTVSEVNRYINRSLEADPILSALNISGELSNVKLYPSGHLYFTIKDQTSKLSCVMFKQNVKHLKGQFIDGDRVKVSGYINVYEREGRYQLICHDIVKEGLGDLYEQFIALKSSLERKGYFDASHKKSIGNVKSVGVITSSVGAAIKDFTSVLKRRNPLIEITIFPSLVQGIDAPANIIKGIQFFNQRSKVDLIVLTRGGGSIEDLWSFNDRDVAEAIYHSKLPIVSAIGHETDFTISDFVADMRAPTPSAAAECISDTIDNTRRLVTSSMRGMITQLEHRIHLAQERLQYYNTDYFSHALKQKITYKREQTALIVDTNTLNISHAIKQKKSDLEKVFSALKYQNPHTLLEKGYALIFDKDQKIVKTINEVNAGDFIKVKFVDGEAKVKVNEVVYDK